jgi:pimeloyl-ACP methyl ester carboxylesterase
MNQKLGRNVFLIFIAFTSLSLIGVGNLLAANLYKGEQIQDAAGFPAITYFVKGDENAPLIVFIPGAHHMARVSYGGHEGYRPEDFLAHWLTSKGYNFLAVSYPIDIARGGMETNHPDFMIRDWGAQAAALARKTIDENGLGERIIVLGWSMGGKCAQSINEAARNEKLNLDFYISLAATPAIPGMIAITREYPMLESGYADRRKNFDGWWKQVASNNKKQGREIVSEEIFKNEYQGDIPINLQGYGQQYKDGAYVMDPLAAQADAKPFNFEDFPLVAMIIPDGRADRRHALVDKAVWSMYNANTIYKRYLSGNKVQVNDLSDAKWQSLLFVTRSVDERLYQTIDGNHFFFVGEPGARATADAVELLEDRVHGLKEELSVILGVEIK